MSNSYLSNDVRVYLFHNDSSLMKTTTLDPGLFSCYDDYYCNSDTLASTGHVVLGIIGLILSLLALALNVLLIPVLSLVGIRSSATYYMIGMAISDCCLLIVNVMIVVIRYLPGGSQLDQLLIYKNFVAYLIPFGTPLKIFCQTLSMSLCTSLVLDRFVYFLTESKPNTAKRDIALKVIVLVVSLTILCKLPNFLVYKIVEKSSFLITVRWTMLAKSWIFIVDTIIFLMIYSILIIFTCVLWHVALICQLLPKTFMIKLFDVPPKERFQRRERLYVMIGLLVGASTFVLKFPHLLRNIFFGFSTIDRSQSQMYKLGVAEMWMEITDLLLIIVKPCIYLLFAVHLRQTLKDMLGLLVRPSKYTEVKVSGGMGKLINLKKNNANCEMNRSDTSNSLLQCPISDSWINDNYPRSCNNQSIDIDALASVVIKSAKTESHSSQMSEGSSTSITFNIHSGSNNKHLIT